MSAPGTFRTWPSWSAAADQMRTRPRHNVTSENGPLAKQEETSMTIYISQGRYTAAAIKGMSAKPEDRSEAVAELFAAAGARLISWYLTSGTYDWLIIAEAPDEPTMISAGLAAAAGGSLSDITTTPSLTATGARSG